jgi:hypothetical protein
MRVKSQRLNDLKIADISVSKIKITLLPDFRQTVAFLRERIKAELA